MAKEQDENTLRIPYNDYPKSTDLMDEAQILPRAVASSIHGGSKSHLHQATYESCISLKFD